MQAISAVVLSIDRLGAGWIGPYGNTWLDTPNFNRLAASGVVCETVLAASPEIASWQRSCWTGCHPLRPAVDSRQVALPALAVSCGASARLLTDDSTVAATAGEFAVRWIESPPNYTPAESVEQSELFRFFAEAIAAVGEQTAPGLLWLHSRGMSGAWDAPLEFRRQFADEEDPQPPTWVAPPEKLLAADFDPDELLGIVQAYAGQVALADIGLGLLLDALDEHPLARETLLVVTAPRGYPLGEHRRVGVCDQALYSELLHVPLLVRFPNNNHALARIQTILQPQELYPLIAATCGWQPSPQPPSQLLRELAGETEVANNVACASVAEQRAIRTPAWFMRQSARAEGIRQELFAKPDDRWEANEVASRCGTVVELLAAELDRFSTPIETGKPAESPPLARILCDTWR